jgi:hypothetical protein
MGLFGAATLAGATGPGLGLGVTGAGADGLLRDPATRGTDRAIGAGEGTGATGLTGIKTGGFIGAEAGRPTRLARDGAGLGDAPGFGDAGASCQPRATPTVKPTMRKNNNGLFNIFLNYPLHSLAISRSASTFLP